jgi:hypothetical protein
MFPDGSPEAIGVTCSESELSGVGAELVRRRRSQTPREDSRSMRERYFSPSTTKRSERSLAKQYV